MQPASQSNDTERLTSLGEYINQKFSTGRAGDIQPETIQEIIQESVSLRQNTTDNRVRDLLVQVEDIAYAALSVGSQEPAFYKWLRSLAAVLEELGQWSRREIMGDVILVETSTELSDDASLPASPESEPEMLYDADLPGDPTIDPPDPEDDLEI